MQTPIPPRPPGIALLCLAVSGCAATLVTYDPLTVPTDPTAAAKLYARACESGHAPGCLDLGRAHLKGRGTTQDLARAAELFRRACELGDADACGELATSLCEGHGVTKDTTRTAALWQRACERGSAMSCWNLGVSRARGTCALKSVAQALPPLEKACEAKLVGACADLGTLLVNSDDIPRETDRGLGYLTTGCNAGLADACEMAAFIAERDLGANAATVALPFWERGCALDNGGLCQRLAAHLFKQPGTKSQAYPLVDKACRLKIDVACKDAKTFRITGDIPPPSGWALVRAARYTRGSPDDEPDRHRDETRSDVIMLTHLYVKTTEVTWGEWKTLMGPSMSPQERERLARGSQACGERCPAVLSFQAALEYLNTLSQKEGLEQCYTFHRGVPSQKANCSGYRVPTEVEWERFARGNTYGMSWLGVHTETLGRGSAELNTIAIHGRENYEFQGLKKCVGSDGKTTDGACGPEPVASKAANPLGLHDVLGNVWEWTWNAYHATAANAVTDPEVEVMNFGPGTNTYRAVRGCAWNSRVPQCRVANRAYVNQRAFEAGFPVGLRPVRTIGLAQ